MALFIIFNECQLKFLNVKIKQTVKMHFSKIVFKTTANRSFYDTWHKSLQYYVIANAFIAKMTNHKVFTSVLKGSQLGAFCP